MSETENCRPFRGRVIVTLGVLVASVAVANFSTVSIPLGNGDGTVAAAVNDGAGLYAASVAVRDFDGATDLDVAVAKIPKDSHQ